MCARTASTSARVIAGATGLARSCCPTGNLPMTSWGQDAPTGRTEIMSKRKWRRGPRILSLDELVRQEIVCWWDKPTSKGWFLSWQFRMAVNAIGEKGVVFYAMPSGATTRFSDEDVIRAERRLRTPPPFEGRMDVINLLNRCDRGYGSVDDVIDGYQSQPGGRHG